MITSGLVSLRAKFNLTISTVVDQTKRFVSNAFFTAYSSIGSKGNESGIMNITRQNATPLTFPLYTNKKLISTIGNFSHA